MSVAVESGDEHDVGISGGEEVGERRGRDLDGYAPVEGRASGPVGLGRVDHDEWSAAAGSWRCIVEDQIDECERLEVFRSFERIRRGSVGCRFGELGRPGRLDALREFRSGQWVELAA